MQLLAMAIFAFANGRLYLVLGCGISDGNFIFTCQCFCSIKNTSLVPVVILNFYVR